MQEETNEREIVTLGEPVVKELPQKEKNVLFSVLLRSVLAYYMEKDTDRVVKHLLHIERRIFSSIGWVTANSGDA